VNAPLHQPRGDDLRGIEQRGGKYRVRKQVAGRAVRKTFGSLRDAVGFRDAIEEELARPDIVITDGMTMNEWVEYWYQHVRRTGGASERGLYDRHIAPAFGTRPLKSIKTPDVVKWLDGLIRTRVAPKHGSKKRPNRRLSWYTRRNIYNVLRAIFRDALRRGHCLSNPCIGVAVERTSHDEVTTQVNEDWPLRPAEQAKLWRYAQERPEILIALVALGTGLRQGEQWALRLVDVHLDEPKPWINVRFGGPRGRKPKFGKVRKVPLFGPGLEAMRRWIAYLPTYAPKNPKGLVFPTPATVSKHGRKYRGGAHRQVGKLPPAWVEAKTSILKRHVKWHWLRHTAATSLLCGWWGQQWQLAEISRLLGHADTQVTGMYAHLTEGALGKLAALTDQAWRGTGSGGGNGSPAAAPSVGGAAPVAAGGGAAATGATATGATTDAVVAREAKRYDQRWAAEMKASVESGITKPGRARRGSSGVAQALPRRGLSSRNDRTTVKIPKPLVGCSTHPGGAAQRPASFNQKHGHFGRLRAPGAPWSRPNQRDRTGPEASGSSAGRGSGVAAYELLNQALVEQPRSFFSVGLDENGSILSDGGQGAFGARRSGHHPTERAHGGGDLVAAIGLFGDAPTTAAGE